MIDVVYPFLVQIRVEHTDSALAHEFGLKPRESLDHSLAIDCVPSTRSLIKLVQVPLQQRYILRC